MNITDVKITKGITLFEETDSKDLLQMANIFASDEAIRDTPLGKEITEITGNKGSYLAGNWRATLQKLVDIFKRQRLEVIGTQNMWLPVSIFYAYCPSVDKAKVKVEFADSKSTEGDSSVEILGLGGGTKFTLETKATLEAESDNKSFALIHEFDSIWEHVRLTQNGRDPIEFCRLAEVNKNHKQSKTSGILQPENDFTTEEIEEKETLFVEPGITVTKKLSVKSGALLKVSNKLKLEQFGLEAGVEVSTANQFEVNYEYSLPGGKSYTAFRPVNAPYWLWSVQG